eukprot:g26868.t1
MRGMNRVNNKGLFLRGPLKLYLPAIGNRVYPAHHSSGQLGAATQEQSMTAPLLDLSGFILTPTTPTASTALAISRPLILAGDFDCIIDPDGQSGGADSKLDTVPRFLMEMVKVAKLHDIFSTPADGAQRRNTWLRPGGSIRSSIGFLFASCTFSVRSTDVKLVFFSVLLRLLLVNWHLQDIQQVGKGTWKLNKKLLTTGNIEDLKRDDM